MPEGTETPNNLGGERPNPQPPTEPKGMDIFNHVPEALAGREGNPLPDAAKPDAPPENQDRPPAEATQNEVIPEDQDANAPAAVKPEAETPPEHAPAWAQAMIEQAVAKVRNEELEPLKNELHALKSDQGRVNKEEDEALIAEAQAHQDTFNKQLHQTNSEIGIALINLVRNLQNTTQDEKGNLLIEVNGVAQPVDPAEVGSFLLNAVSANQGLMHQWGQGLQTITTKVEAVLFKRKPDYAQYKAQFDGKASQIYGAMYLDQVKADPHRVEIIYEMLHNAAVAQELPSVRQKAVEAARKELDDKRKAGSPQRGAGQRVGGEAPSSDADQVKKAHESLGLGMPTPSRPLGAPAVTQTPGRAKII